LVIVAVIVVFSARGLFCPRRRGVVTGILYTIENSSAVIDWHVVKEAQTVYGATVVKIDRTEVEFEKNGKRWKQRVGQRPHPAWTDNEDKAPAKAP
jgi:hypothetical protein